MKVNKLFTLLSIITMSLSLGSCQAISINSVDKNDSQNLNLIDEKLANLYQMAKKTGYNGTYEQWLASIKGEDGVSITSVDQIEDDKDGNSQFEITLSNGEKKVIKVNKGDKGDPGQNGKDGANILTGIDAPSKDIGEVGDIYFDTSTWDVYSKSESGWLKIGNIKGDVGETGQTGEAGNNGADGSSILTGDKAPTAEIGKDSDLYLDTNTNDLYQKNNNQWVKLGNLKGGTGEAGNSGNNGIDGHTILTGTTDPISGLGKIGDLYLNKTTSDIYEKTKDGWNFIGNLKGETGNKGETTQQLLYGEGYPGLEIGKIYDLYLDLSTFDLYQREEASWRLIGTLKGNDGKDGDKGEQGIPGKDGQNGDDGAQGDSAYDLYKKNFGYVGSETDWLKDLKNNHLGFEKEYKLRFATYKFYDDDYLGNPNIKYLSDEITYKNGEKVVFDFDLTNKYCFVDGDVKNINECSIDFSDYRAYKNTTIIMVEKGPEHINEHELLKSAIDKLTNATSYTAKVDITGSEGNISYTNKVDEKTIQYDKYVAGKLETAKGYRDVSVKSDIVYASYKMVNNVADKQDLYFDKLDNLKLSNTVNELNFTYAGQTFTSIDNHGDYIKNFIPSEQLPLNAKYEDPILIKLLGSNISQIFTKATIVAGSIESKTNIVITFSDINATTIEGDFTSVDNVLTTKSWKAFLDSESYNLMNQIENGALLNAIPFLNFKDYRNDLRECLITSTYGTISYANVRAGEKINNEDLVQFQTALTDNGWEYNVDLSVYSKVINGHTYNLSYTNNFQGIGDDVLIVIGFEKVN